MEKNTGKEKVFSYGSKIGTAIMFIGLFLRSVDIFALGIVLTGIVGLVFPDKVVKQKEKVSGKNRTSSIIGIAMGLIFLLIGFYFYHNREPITTGNIISALVAAAATFVLNKFDIF